MSTEIREDKIAIDANELEKIAIAENEKLIEISGEWENKIAIAGNGNRITTNGVEPYTAFVGKRLEVNIKGQGGAAAVAGKELKATIAGDNPITAIASIAGGSVGINGNGCATALSAGGAEVNITSNFNRTAICECRSINVTGDGNHIAIVNCSPRIKCTGKNNRIVCFGFGAAIQGVSDNWVSLAYHDENWKCGGVVSGCIGQNGLEENVRYYVENGQFVEAAVVDGDE